MIRAIWHAGFTVSDLNRSLAFYVGLLGFELVDRQLQDNDYTARLVGIPGACLDVAILAVPGVRQGDSSHDLELIQYVHPAGKPLPQEVNDPGAAHLAFAVSDIAAEYERLCAAGVSFVSSPNVVTTGVNAGGSTCYLYDPDGIVLEMHQPRLEDAA